MKTQEEMQEIWDRELLQGWKEDMWMMVVAHRFLLQVKPTLVDGLRVKEGFREFFVPLGLKRCLDNNTHKGGPPNFVGKGQVRAFVSSRCERLSNCLWSGKHTNQKLLENIDNFTWKQMGKAVSRNRVRKAYKKLKNQGVITIRARELTKKHDWKTVK
jgi:hypothetical protein